MDDVTDEREHNRLAAETFMPIMVEAFHDSVREIASLSRWLLATLVLINGAAVIAVLPLEISSAIKLGAAGSFLIGILGALGAGIWSLYAFKRISIAANTMMGYWLTVAGDAPRLAALEASMKQHMDQAVGSRGTHRFVSLSVFGFLLGCLVTGWGLLI